jgi:hypothetical protein
MFHNTSHSQFFHAHQKRITLGVAPKVADVGNEACLFKGVEKVEEFAAAKGGGLEQGEKGECVTLCFVQTGEDIIDNF